MAPQAVAEASSAPPPVAPVVMEPDPDVERGLLASVKVLNFAKGRLEELGEAARARARAVGPTAHPST